MSRSASPIGRSLKRRSAKSLGLKSFAELTTPSAALRRLRAFLLMPQRRTDHPVCGASEASRLFINAAATPPFQGGECVRTETVCQFIHTFSALGRSASDQTLTQGLRPGLSSHRRFAAASAAAIHSHVLTPWATI